jgi:flagellar L-ring protein precursor FlgH
MRGVVLALLLATASPAAGQSLYREGAPGAALFADLKARGVNDIVTVLIVEQSSTSRTANTTTSTDSSRAAGINEFPGFGRQSATSALRENSKFDIAGKSAHQGKGSIDRTDKVSGQIAARVVKVLDNGNLVIEGRRAVLVNQETQLITISGVVRPQDISGANTVLSSQVADAEVQLVGKGVLDEAQNPGILFRLLDWIKLF